MAKPALGASAYLKYSYYLQMYLEYNLESADTVKSKYIE
jgi:hypothetical protein